MTLRSRVTCSTNWSSQTPVFVIFHSLPLSYCLSMFQGAYLLLLIILSVSSTKHSVNICWMFFISIFRKGANRRTKRSQNFPNHLKGSYREVQLLLREELWKGDLDLVGGIVTWYSMVCSLAITLETSLGLWFHFRDVALVRLSCFWTYCLTDVWNGTQLRQVLNHFRPQ